MSITLRLGEETKIGKFNDDKTVFIVDNEERIPGVYNAETKKFSADGNDWDVEGLSGGKKRRSSKKSKKSKKSSKKSSKKGGKKSRKTRKH